MVLRSSVSHTTSGRDICSVMLVSTFLLSSFVPHISAVAAGEQALDDRPEPLLLHLQRHLMPNEIENAKNLVLSATVTVGSGDGAVAVHLQVDTGSSDVSFLTC